MEGLLVRYDTYPRHPYDESRFHRAVERFWEGGLLQSRKKSHFWMWHTIPQSEAPLARFTPHPDKTARPNTGFPSRFWNTNFGWRAVAVMWPEIGMEPFQVGFVTESGFARYCSIILPAGSEFGMLLGPEEVSFFAWTVKEHRPIHLMLRARTTRGALNQNIPLL